MKPEHPDTVHGFPDPIAGAPLVSGRYHEFVFKEVEIAGIQRRACAAIAPASEVEQIVHELGEPFCAAPSLGAGEEKGGHGPPDGAPAPGEYARPQHLLSRQEAEHIVEDVLREGADAVHPARHGQSFPFWSGVLSNRWCAPPLGEHRKRMATRKGGESSADFFFPRVISSAEYSHEPDLPHMMGLRCFVFLVNFYNKSDLLRKKKQP